MTARQERTDKDYSSYDMELNEQQLLRYSRNLVLAELGPAGQSRLLRSSVLVVGAGGLGSPAALYLAAAGIGRLGIVDSDRVELSNLQRQILHDTATLGMDKTISAAGRVNALNPDVRVECHGFRLDESNAAALVRDYDFVIDGSDNFRTKLLLNDACVLERRPLSHAGVLGFQGQLLTVVPGAGGACLRCLMPEIPGADETPGCAQAGVLGAAAGVIGSLQAAEAVKVLCAVGEPLAGRMLSVDLLNMRFHVSEAPADPSCPVCSASGKTA